MTNVRKFGRIGLAVLLLPFLLIAEGVGVHGSLQAAEGQDLQTITLQIEGMSCGVCIKDIRAALLKVPGVKAVEFQIKKKWLFFADYADARVLVSYEPGTTTVDALIQAVENAGSVTGTYTAKIVS